MPKRESMRPRWGPAWPLLVAMPPLLYDAYVFLGVRGGRDVFLARVGEPSLALGVAGLLLLLVGLAGHVLYALRTLRALSLDDPYGHASSGNRRLQQWSAPFVAFFLLAHQRHSVFVAAIEGIGAGGLFERIRNDCDGYAWLAVYVVGIAALSLHVGQGAYALVSRGRGSDEGMRKAARVLVVLSALAFFLFAVDALAAFALGATLFGAV